MQNLPRSTVSLRWASGYPSGYDPEVYEARKKGERSLPLIEMMVAENPHDPLYKYYLGRELCSLKRFDEASSHLQDAHNELGKDERADKDLVFDIAWFLIRAMVSAQQPAEKTLKIARDVVAKIPNKPDLWYLIATYLSIWTKSLRLSNALSERSHSWKPSFLHRKKLVSVI